MSRIEELKKELELEERKRRESQRERAEEYNKNPITNVFKYSVKVWDIHKSCGLDPEYSKEEVVITRKWMNREEVLTKMKEEGFGLFNFPDEVVTSMSYYLYHGVLQHTGGGWVLLKEPQLVSEKQWERLLNGDIPSEMIKDFGPYKPWC
jgi:hypothetical protein